MKGMYEGNTDDVGGVYDNPWGDGIQCLNTCDRVISEILDSGGSYTRAKSRKTTGDDWTIVFRSDTYLSWPFREQWTSELVPDAMDLKVDHCLAEPIDRDCSVGLSNILLLIVIICLLIKTITAMIITALVKHNHEPLVTLGDAIASFIRYPDNKTVDMCSITQVELRQTAKSAILPGPQTWQGKIHRRWSVVPMAVWLSSYLLFAASIAIVAVFFFMALSTTDL